MKISSLAVLVLLTLGVPASGFAQSEGDGGNVPQPTPKPVVGVLYGAGVNAKGEATQSSTPIASALELAQSSGDEVKRICSLTPKMKKFTLHFQPYVNNQPISFTFKLAAGNCNAQSRK